MRPIAAVWRSRAWVALLACCLGAGCNSVRFGDVVMPPEGPQRDIMLAKFGALPEEQEPPLSETTKDANAEAERFGAQPRPMSERDKGAEASPRLPSEPEPEPILDETDGQRIDLETALQLGGADNPTIAIAEEAVRGSLAEQMQARALLLPDLNAGANLRLHRGAYLTNTGEIININVQSLYFGGGAQAIGSGTVVVPGIRLFVNAADAFYAPRAARHRVVQTRFDAVNTRHYTLMDIGVRYLALVEAQANLEAYRQSLKDVEEVVRLTTNHAKAGLGRDSDAKRALAEALLLRGQAQTAREAQGVAAAELARLLDLDPSVNLRSADLVPPLLELIDLSAPLESLLDEAIARHPEMVARSAEVNFQDVRLRQEKARMWLPLVSVGLSAGSFGGGNQDSNPRLQNFGSRTDFDVAFIWSLRNLGVGNDATQGAARSGLEQAQLERLRVMDRIRNEVSEAHALTRQRRQQMDIARKRLETSQAAYTQDLTRIRNQKGLPIEVLQSANQLIAARLDLVRAMIGYSQAQLQLYTALGNPPAAPRSEQ